MSQALEREFDTNPYLTTIHEIKREAISISYFVRFMSIPITLAGVGWGGRAFKLFLLLNSITGN